MSLQGRWRIVEMPDYTDDYPDMVQPAYMLFEANGSGEFAFGCVTGQIWAGGAGDSVAFSWGGSDEGTEVNGDGWAELQPDGSLKGEISSTTATKPTSSPAANLLQQPARGCPMIEHQVAIRTAGGEMSTFVCHPERAGPHPMILFYMDAPGIREELRDMARRLATTGYYVMLPNLSTTAQGSRSSGRSLATQQPRPASA